MFPVLVGAAFLLVFFAGLVLLIGRNVVRVAPHEAAVITGKRRVVRDPVTGMERQVGYRVITGGSALRTPMFERVDRLPLNEMSIALDLEDQRDSVGRAQRISLLVNCHIAGESPLLDRAIPRFLGMRLEDIENIVRTTVESRVIGALLSADLETGTSTWSALEQQLITEIHADLSALGVVVDTVIFRGPPNAHGLVSIAAGGGHLPVRN